MWKDSAVVNSGLSLLAQWLANKKLIIDKAAGGTGTVPAASIMAQTGLRNKKQDISVAAAKVVDKGVRVSLHITNQYVTTDYTLHQIGIWGRLENGAETLIALYQDDNGILIPKNSGVPDFSYTFYATITMSNTGTWEVVIDTSALISKAILEDAIEDHNQDLNAHSTSFSSLNAHLDEMIASADGAHGFRYNETDGVLEKYDEPTDTWIPVAVGAPKLQELVITTPPAKTIYRAGEVFVPDGMVVTASYSQFASAPVTGYKVTPSGPLAAADKFVTISYTENGITKTVQQPITVGELYRLSITTPPTTTAFVYGAYFDPAGMVVRATYTDNSTSIVTDKVTYSPTRPLIISDTSVTVSYTENGITKTAAQPILVTKRLTSLVVSSPPAKIVYIEGETFSAGGMFVQAYYNDGTYIWADGYTYTPAGPLTIADTGISIAYTENGVTVTAIQPITVKPNVSYILAENDWETITRVSEAGDAQIYWSIGDTKDITLTTSETLTLQIYGFDHDDLQSSGKAGITFGMKDLMASKRSINFTATNNGGFKGSVLYTWLVNDLWNSFPDDLRSVIKTVNKKSGAGGENGELVTEEMTLFIFSEIEVVGAATNSVAGEGAKYPIFTDTTSRIKASSNGSDSGEIWWLRSPQKLNAYHFRNISINGKESQAYPSASYGICFGFCV